jgi:hypothetical protein
MLEKLFDKRTFSRVIIVLFVGFLLTLPVLESGKLSCVREAEDINCVLTFYVLGILKVETTPIYGLKGTSYTSLRERGLSYGQVTGYALELETSRGQVNANMYSSGPFFGLDETNKEITGFLEDKSKNKLTIVHYNFPAFSFVIVMAVMIIYYFARLYYESRSTYVVRSFPKVTDFKPGDKVLWYTSNPGKKSPVQAMVLKTTTQRVQIEVIEDGHSTITYVPPEKLRAESYKW